MKKFLLVALMTGLLMCLVATPAYGAKSVPHLYPPLDTPIIVPAFGDGVWIYGTSLDLSDIMLWQASYPHEDAYKAMPARRESVVTVGWLGSVYGQVKDVPHQVRTTIDITGPNGFHQHFDPADTAEMWAGPQEWDEWWTGWLGGPPPELFNPAAQAGVYLNHLWVPVGPFPVKGTYHLSLIQTQVLPTLDLIDWYGTGRPLHPGSEFIDWSASYDFQVGK